MPGKPRYIRFRILQCWHIQRKDDIVLGLLHFFSHVNGIKRSNTPSRKLTRKHLSQVMRSARFHGASAMVEEFQEDPRFDLHQKTSEIMGCPRRHAKSINLGIMYGMGTAKLGRELGISADAARDLYQSHKSLVPFLHDLSQHLDVGAAPIRTRCWPAACPATR